MKRRPLHPAIMRASATTGSPGSTPQRSMPVLTSITTGMARPFARPAASSSWRTHWTKARPASHSLHGGAAAGRAFAGKAARKRKGIARV